MPFDALRFGRRGRCQSRFRCRSGVLNYCLYDTLPQIDYAILLATRANQPDRQIELVNSFFASFLLLLSHKPSVLLKQFKQITAHVIYGRLIFAQAVTYRVLCTGITPE